MEKQFVPYELAVKLKELGYKSDYHFKEYDTEGFLQHNGLLQQHELDFIEAPLWQQAFDWFREKYRLLNHLTTHLNTWGEGGALETYYGYRIMIDKDGYKCEVWEHISTYDTYEQARLACLEKLIELVKGA